MCNVDESQKIVKILEFTYFVDYIQFKKNDDNFRKKILKDRIRIVVAVNMV